MNMQELIDAEARVEAAKGLLAYIERLREARQVFAGDKKTWDVTYIRISSLPKLREIAIFDVEAQMALAQQEYAAL